MNESGQEVQKHRGRPKKYDTNFYKEVNRLHYEDKMTLVGLAEHYDVSLRTAIRWVKTSREILNQK